MMSTNGDDIGKLDLTIQRLVNNYTNGGPKERIFTYNTPNKRPASDESTSKGNEDAAAPPFKKFKAPTDLFGVGSPREVRRMRADLLENKNTIRELKHQITQLHSARREMCITFDHETKMTNLQLQNKEKKIEELEDQLQSIRKRELDLKLQFNEIKTKYDELKVERETSVNNLESQLETIKEEKMNQSFTESGTINTLSRKVEELESLYQAAQEEIEAHKKYVEELNKKVSEKVNYENELELKEQALQKAQQQIKQMEFAKETVLEIQQQAKTQHQKLMSYDAMVKENQKLRDDVCKLKDAVHNKLLLEEEVYDLKTRLVHLKDQEKKFHQTQLSLNQVEKNLEEYRSLARAVCETTSNNDMSLARSLRGAVEKLQQQEIHLTSEKMHLDSQLSTTNHEAQVAKNELEKSQSHIKELQDTVKHQKTLLQRLQRKVQLLIGERDSYRKQLDSYEKDLTICLNPASSANPGSAQFQSQYERIANLEKTVENYRELLSKLENDLKEAEAHLEPDSVPIKMDQVKRLQDEICKMKNENSMLRERKDRLEIQLEEILVGHDDPKGAKIVHPVKNPLAECLQQREQEKERLEEEVVKLKRKIKKLEEGLEASKLGDITIDHKQVLELKEELKSTKQKLENYRDILKHTMQEFRNVVYLLFGYKVDKSSNKMWKITSMYSDSSEDQLVFELNEQGTLNLFENEFSASLEDMVDLHLRQQRSLPVFLSSLTIDLFTNKTITKIDESSEDEVDDEEEDEESDSS